MILTKKKKLSRRKRKPSVSKKKKKSNAFDMKNMKHRNVGAMAKEKKIITCIFVAIATGNMNCRLQNV